MPAVPAPFFPAAEPTDIAYAATAALTHLGLTDLTSRAYITRTTAPGFRIVAHPDLSHVSITLSPRVAGDALTRAHEALASIGAPMLPAAHSEGFPRILLFPPSAPSTEPLRTVTAAWWATDQTSGFPAPGELRTTRVRLCADAEAAHHTDESHIPAILATAFGLQPAHIRIVSITPR